jgi:hypothetical protein
MTPNYMSSIDLTSGFFQMALSKDSARYTAFNTCFGTYEFLRLPMGLKTSPNTFQLMMDRVLGMLYLKSLVCELRYLKSQQKRKFCGEFLSVELVRLVTRTIGLVIGKSSFSAVTLDTLIHRLKILSTTFLTFKNLPNHSQI